jgi:hypothetical protein
MKMANKVCAFSGEVGKRDYPTFRQSLSRHDNKSKKKQNTNMEGDAQEPPMLHTLTKHASASPDLHRSEATGSQPATMPNTDEPVSTTEQNEPAGDIEQACGSFSECSWTSADQTGLDAHLQGKHPLGVILSCERCSKWNQKYTFLVLHVADVHLHGPLRAGVLEHYAEEHKAMHQKADLRVEVRVEEVHKVARKIVHQELDLMHEQAHKAIHQKADLTIKEINESRDRLLVDAGRPWAVVSQCESQSLDLYDRLLEQLFQLKASYDREGVARLKWAHERVDSITTSSADGLHQESSS